MEWSALSENDRRTVMAQMNLDASGRPLPAAATPPLSNGAAPLRKAPLTVTLPESAILKGCASEIFKALPFWCSLRRIRQTLQRAPQVDEAACTFRLVSAIPALVFDGYVVGWVESVVPVSYTLQGQLRRDVFTFESMHFIQQQLQQTSKTKKTKKGAAKGKSTAGTTAAGKDGGSSVTAAAASASTGGGGSSFELQSVQRKGQPLLLQCVAGTLVHFAFVVSYWHQRRRHEAALVPTATTSEDTDEEDGDTTAAARGGRGCKRPRDESDGGGGATIEGAAAASPTWPPFTIGGPILILGMGGNIMCACLATLFPAVPIHVVEIEPAVYATCAIAGAIPPSVHVHCHVADVLEVLGASPPAASASPPLAAAAEAAAAAAAVPQLPDTFEMIFLDCFDPLVGKMMHANVLLRKLYDRLSPQNGLLVVNVHALPTEAVLAPFAKVFGSPFVQALDIAGCVQCVVCCVRAVPVQRRARTTQRRAEAAALQRFHLKVWNGLVSDMNDQFAAAAAAAAAAADQKDAAENVRDSCFEIDTGLVKTSKAVPVGYVSLFEREAVRVWESKEC